MASSTKRTAFSKSVRFEIFKRDKFTCQYCGRKAPDVVLHIDHIEPVSKGGDNEIVNLITGCHECNLGKSDKRLSDNTVVEKQRKQLELLQERREQIELMFEWKKSLSKLDEETIGMLREYIEAKIEPHTVNELGESTIKNYLKKFSVAEVLDAVDLAAKKYLRFSPEGQITQESAEDFFKKVGGILHTQKMPPVQRKLAYIKGICRNRFNYFNEAQGSMLLNQYVDALRTHWDYDDEKVLQDLDKELIPKTINEVSNWSQWRKLLEEWIESIKKPKEEPSPFGDPEEFTPEKMDAIFEGRTYDLDASIKALVHILKPFPNFKENELVGCFLKHLLRFLEDMDALTEETIEGYDKDDMKKQAYIAEFAYSDDMMKFIDQGDHPKDGWFLSKLDEAASKIISYVYDEFYFSHVI